MKEDKKMNTENFTGRAEAYSKGRPGYPKEAIDYICTLVPPDAVFADIGAGTGKFTERLAERGFSMFSVEPNADMREQLAITLEPFPRVKIFDGTAETTKLPGHSVDVVTVAHALHWFNLDMFHAECRRIAKPGGLVIVVYNFIPDQVGGMTAISKPVLDAFFTKPTIMEFSNPMDYTRDMWLAYSTSQENNPLPSAPKYGEHISLISAEFDRISKNGIFRLNRVTKVYSERID